MSSLSPAGERVGVRGWRRHLAQEGSDARSATGVPRRAASASEERSKCHRGAQQVPSRAQQVTPRAQQVPPRAQQVLRAGQQVLRAEQQALRAGQQALRAKRQFHPGVQQVPRPAQQAPPGRSKCLPMHSERAPRRGTPRCEHVAWLERVESASSKSMKVTAPHPDPLPPGGGEGALCRSISAASPACATTP